MPFFLYTGEIYMHPLEMFRSLLDYYKMDVKEFLEFSSFKSVEELSNYHKFSMIDKALSRIKKALDSDELILIYGDYDADGILATSILVRTFSLLKKDKNISYYIPSRFKDGYGLNVTQVEKAHQESISLIITVDNGVSQFEAIKKAKELGIDVIVTDHHDFETLPSESYATIHYALGYSEVAISGGYTAYLLSYALLGDKFDPYLFSLGAISLITDMMPIKKDNHHIVKLLIKILKKYLTTSHIFYPLLLLSEGKEVEEDAISSLMAPKINAIGRLCSGEEANEVVKFLTCADERKAHELYQLIYNVNEERKNLTNEVASNLTVSKDSLTFIYKKDFKEGLLGLLANRVLGNLNHPVILMTDAVEEGIIKGSMRSKKGFSVIKALRECDDLLLAYGGHELAGGFSLRKENLEAFENKMVELDKKYPFVDLDIEAIKISKNDIDENIYAVVEMFAPFGVDFKKPTFLLEDVKIDTLSKSKDQKHIIHNFAPRRKIVIFNYRNKVENSNLSYDLYGYLKTSTFKNIKSIDFQIEAIKTHI